MLDENIEFFKWLFDTKDINLESSIDFTLSPNQKDDNIYYTKQLGDFFKTSPMTRISRVLQLGTSIGNDHNLYQTRFEHCIGTYNRKKDIILRLYKDPEFKDFVEKNDLKEYLIAELIKSAGHDIGHLPLSHLLERHIAGKPGFHEIMGKRILLENDEIREVLDNISPTLHSSLEKVLTEDVFGFDLIDEGNYDIDRFDYIVRDGLYSGTSRNIEFEPFNIMQIAINSNNELVKNNDGSLVDFPLSAPDNSNTFTLKKIPVFDITSVPAIVNFLELRVKAYKEIYLEPISKIKDSSVIFLMDELLSSNDTSAPDLKHFLSALKEKPDEIDLNEYLSWDDLRFYNQILDIAEFSEDKKRSELATFVTPDIKSLMNMVFTMLDMKKVNIKNLSKQDQELILRIRSLIHSDTTVAKNIRDENYFYKTAKFSTNPEQIALKQNSKDSPYQFIKTCSVQEYEPETPIYVQNHDGKIYTIDNLPNKDFTLSTKPEKIHVVFSLLPLMQDKDEKSILNESFKAQNLKAEVQDLNQTRVNMDPIQVGHKIENYFDEIDL